MVLIYAHQNHNYSSATIATAIENKIDVEKRFQYVHIIHTYIFSVQSLFFPFPFYFYPALFSPLKFLLFHSLLPLQFQRLHLYLYYFCLTNEKIKRERLNLMCSYGVECFYVKFLCAFTMFLPFKVCFLYQFLTLLLFLPTTYQEISRYIVIILLLVRFLRERAIAWIFQRVCAIELAVCIKATQRHMYPQYVCVCWRPDHIVRTCLTIISTLK